MRPSSRGPGAIRVPDCRRCKEHVEPTLRIMGTSSRELGTICVPGSRGKEATPAPGAQRSVHGSGVLPVSAIGGMGSSNVPLLASQLVRKLPGWRPLGLELDPYRIPGAWVPEEDAGGTPCWDWTTVRELAVGPSP